MTPKYTLEKIKFGTDKSTFDRAVDLYEDEKVTRFVTNASGCSAVVMGTQPYHVVVSNQAFDQGKCNCYLRQRDILCKHMVAVAIMAVKGDSPLKDSEVEYLEKPRCSGRTGELADKEMELVKTSIAQAYKMIKAYTGPSRIWFSYQAKLSEGCARLCAVLSQLPVSLQTADLIIKLLLQLDRKLCTGGVDDSDGTVGGFVEEAVVLLQDFAGLDKECLKSFEKLVDRETCFGWEAPLVALLEGNNKLADVK